MTNEQHNLTYIEDVTREMPAKVDDDGNIEVDYDGAETISVHETSVWCSHCGPLYSDDALSSHGLDEYWEQV